MKYQYDRKAVKKHSIKPFLNMVSDRNRVIEQAETGIPQTEFNVNLLAARLHPEIQYVCVEKIVDHGDAKSFYLVPDQARGTKELAYFRAGQYVSVSLEFDGNCVNKPYAIRSNPKDALGEKDNRYIITVKRSYPGFASDYLLDRVKEGDKLEISGPLGEFYYQKYRDAQHVIALAGGSGITPFYSMAAAIVSGIEDFRLTILYGSRKSEGILLKEELEELESRSGGKVKVVHVLSDEEKEGYEHGFLTADLIRKYAPADAPYSLFMCGPKPMYRFGKEQAELLGLRRKYVRMELPGDPKAPETKEKTKESAGEYHMTVHIGEEVKQFPIPADQTILQTLEKAGIKAPSHCRSGVCGWCHSKLLSGEVSVPEDADGRRLADLKFGWIHPCASFAVSDIEIEVYPIVKEDGKQ